MNNEPIDPGGVAARILGLRTGKAARPNLRRGHSVATEHYAYPYLAPLWMAHGMHLRVPLLRVAALAATAIDVGDHPDRPLGQHLRASALADVAPDAKGRALERHGRRLVWAQTGDVEKLHMVMRSMLAGHMPVSWRDVVATYLWWDQRDHEQRRVHRRRLLEQFYSPRPTTDDAPAA